MDRNISILTLLLFITVTGFGQAIHQLGYYSVNGIMSVAAKSNFMILSNGRIVDNTIPSSPTLVSQYSFVGDGTSVIVNENSAYFGTGMGNTLFIADISNINFPLHKSSIPFNIGHGVFGMDISDNTLFVALGVNGTVCSIDISDESNPDVLDTLYISGGQCRDIVISDDFAFAAHENGLKVIDISNPSGMQLITSIGSGYNSIDISESLVFLGKSSGGIDVYNILDPVNPTPAFSMANTGGTAWDLKYKDDHVYLATNSNGLFIYKIEDNTGIEMANFPNSGNGQSFGVCLQDSLVLLSGLINGVAILQYDSTWTVDINNMSSFDQINIYPNPATNYVHLESSSAIDISQIEIINLQGEVLKKQQYLNIRKAILDVKNIPKGIYVVRIYSRSNIYHSKLVIN